jgi:hypothetical protein
LHRRAQERAGAPPEGPHLDDARLDLHVYAVTVESDAEARAMYGHLGAGLRSV